MRQLEQQTIFFNEIDSSQFAVVVVNDEKLNVGFECLADYARCSWVSSKLLLVGGNELDSMHEHATRASVSRHDGGGGAPSISRVTKLMSFKPRISQGE